MRNRGTAHTLTTLRSEPPAPTRRYASFYEFIFGGPPRQGRELAIETLDGNRPARSLRLEDADMSMFYKRISDSQA